MSTSTHLPNSTAQRDLETLIHPYTNLKVHQETGPLVITRGEGVRVFGEDGTPYIEAMAGLWCTSLGWNEQRLIDAATSALQRLPYYHSFTHKVPDVTVDLAEKLLAMAPVKMGKVFFANSGSEAVDTAIKLVWYVNNARGKPNKKKSSRAKKPIMGSPWQGHRSPVCRPAKTILICPSQAFYAPVAHITTALPNRANLRKTLPPAWLTSWNS